MAFCSECGANVADNVKFCTECGKDMTAEKTPPPNTKTAQSAQPEIKQPNAETKTTINTESATTQAQAAQPAAAQAICANANTAPPKGSQYAVAGVFKYIGLMILFAIPILGFVFCIIWSFSKHYNYNLRNFARANLIFALIALLVCVLSFMFISTLITDFLNYFLTSLSNTSMY